MSHYYEQASPATSNATNRTNRGGRPKEWTEPRTRRLSRLYVYTSLKVDEILKILEDDVWSPGKEAANKHLNNLLGKDPRWLRPKDVTEQRQRVAGLKHSDRGRSSSQSSSISQKLQSPMSTAQETFPQTYQRTDTMDSRSLGRSSASSFEKNDIFPPIPMRTATTFQTPAVVNHNHGLRDLNNSSTASFTRFLPSVDRQSTTMTTSTNFSVASAKTRDAYYSIKQKLQGHELHDVKDVFRLLKRFTISNEAGSERSSTSPNSATGAFLPSSFARFQGQTEGITTDPAQKYVLPGAFVGTEHSTYDYSTGKDQYGNTMFHVMAASEVKMYNLIGIVSQESHTCNPLLNATNTGGQTFLHVLHKNWFREDSQLVELVSKLRQTQFDFYATDNYGRTFFHMLRQNMNTDSVLMRKITGFFGNTMNLWNRRDAFGVKPMQLRAMTFPTNREEARPTHLTIPNITGQSQQKIKDHAQLLRIINGASSSPNGEDSQGRNALHCLAEVIIGMASIEAHANGTKPAKRKLNAQDEPIIQTCPLSQRLQYLETVLLANVDVNHYNASGDTVLMAFISHIVDGADDKDLEQLIKLLLKAGAKLESRNRNGETVLQVAAKLGQKFAVRVLLEQGANFHVRNSDGRSVLQSIDDQMRMTGEDRSDEFARLEATRGVLTGRFSRFQVVQQPTLLQEWQAKLASSPKVVV